MENAVFLWSLLILDSSRNHGNLLVQRVWRELRGNQNGFVSWCSIYFNNVWVVRLMNETIFKRKIWVASGFHCADTATKLVFPSKLLFYMPNHQEFPTFCTRFLRGCSCWIHRCSKKIFDQKRQSSLCRKKKKCWRGMEGDILVGYQEESRSSWADWNCMVQFVLCHVDAGKACRQRSGDWRFEERIQAFETELALYV